MSLIEILIYVTGAGKSPFDHWLNKLDRTTRAIVRTRIDRVCLGNFGDSKPIKNGDGIHELRIDYGAGYRIYYGKHASKIVVLLFGGDKSTQSRDIVRAKKYWVEYKGVSND